MKTTILIFFVIGFAILNILTLISSGVHDFLYRGLSSLPISQLLSNSPTSKRNKLSSDLTKSRNKTAKYKNNLAFMKKRIKGLTGKIATRSVKNVSLNMASIPAESVPWIGSGVVVAVTAIDIKDSCDTMNDMNEIMNTLELKEYDDETSSICGQQINFEKEYSEMQENLGGFVIHLKKESDSKLEKFKDTIGGTSAIAVERMKNNIDKVKKGMDSIYDKIGGTLYHMLND